MSIDTEPFLKAFGKPVIYDDDRHILGIYDKQPVDIGGVDTIAETVKVATADVPNLAYDKTFYLEETDTDYVCKGIDPERSGFTVVMLEKQ